MPVGNGMYIPSASSSSSSLCVCKERGEGVCWYDNTMMR